MRRIQIVLNNSVLGLSFLALTACVPDTTLSVPTAADGSALPTAPDTPVVPPSSGEEPIGDGQIIQFVDTHNYDVNEAKIDLLFIVDNSGSMSDTQQILSDSFEGFIQAFSQRAINARIGVTSTDLSGTSGTSYSNASNAYPNFIQKGPGGLIAKIEGTAATTPRFLETESMAMSQVVTRFQNNAFLGIQGSGSENGIGALAAFFGNPLNGTNGWNTGFMRGSDVPFHAIIITDEDISVANRTSQTPGSSPSHYMRRYPTALDNYFTEMMAIFNGVKNSNQGMFKIHAVAGDPNSDKLATCGLLSQNSVLSTGDGYKLFTNATNGSFIDLCQGPFHQSLASLGQEIAVEVERDFALTRLPRDIYQIRVWVNNVELIQNHPNGFTYRAAENEIRISEGVALSHLGQYEVKIQYPFEQL